MSTHTTGNARVDELLDAMAAPALPADVTARIAAGSLLAAIGNPAPFYRASVRTDPAPQHDLDAYRRLGRSFTPLLRRTPMDPQGKTSDVRLPHRHFNTGAGQADRADPSPGVAQRPAERRVPPGMSATLTRDRTLENNGRINGMTVRDYRLTFRGHPLGEFVAELSFALELLAELKTTEYRFLRQQAEEIETDLEDQDGYRVRCERVELKRGDDWQRLRLLVPVRHMSLWELRALTPASIVRPTTWPE